MPTNPEILRPNDKGFLPKDFPLYLPDFQERLAASFDKPPVKGLLFRRYGWTPHFSGLVERADEASRKTEVCSHGLDNHLLQVAQNALALSHLLSLTSGVSSGVLSDENLIFASLTHDLGYSDPNLKWNDKEAPGHQDASIRMLHAIRTEGGDLFPSSQDTLFDSLAALDQNFGHIRKAIKTTSEDESIILNAAERMNQNPTPENIFPVVISLADKFDLFRAERLRGLVPPERYDDNPYFFVSNAIGKYSLDVSDDELTYQVELKEHAPGEKWTLPQWKEKVDEAGYGTHFKAAEIFARSQKRTFEIAEMEKAA